MGAPCKICRSGEAMRTVAEMVAAGASDQSISDRLGNGIGRMSVSRHRKAHLLAPARALAAAAAKGHDVAAQRNEAVAAAQAAAAAGDPLVFVQLPAIVNDLRTVHERLERTAGAAEVDGQRLAVSALSAQQLRAAEVRAKIGGVGQFAPSKATDGAPGQFSITINLGDLPGVTMTAIAPASARVVDVDPD